MAILKNTLGQFLKDTQGRFLWQGTLTQLETPQNPAVSSTTASWDEVDNATSYEIFSDGVSIGTYAPTKGTVTGTKLALTGASVSGENVTLNTGSVSGTKVTI